MDGSGGSGGSGGGTTGSFASVTWKNRVSPSGNGFVDVSSGTDGDYVLGKTAAFAKSETGAAVCFIGYGSGTILTLMGAGDWWNPSKSWLGAQVGKNPDDLSYMTSKQASIDSASRLITYRNTSVGSRPANAFYWRAGGTSNSWVDPEAVGSNQSAIHCAFVPNNGVAEVYSYSMSTGTGGGSGTGLNPQSLSFNAPVFVSPFEFIDTNTGFFVARSSFEKLVFDVEFPAEVEKLPINDIYTAEGDVQPALRVNGQVLSTLEEHSPFHIKRTGATLIRWPGNNQLLTPTSCEDGG
ncbi:MAG: hypothetical protein U0519_03060 [Candidatus Gracilibacteria bacterium]